MKKDGMNRLHDEVDRALDAAHDIGRDKKFADAKSKVREWLERHDCDGLVCNECSCWLDDLMPCGEVRNDCVAARAVEYRNEVSAL